MTENETNEKALSAEPEEAPAATPEPTDSAAEPAEEGVLRPASEGEQPESPGTPKPAPKKKHAALKVIGAVVAVVVVACVAFGAWLYFDDAEQLQHVPENTTLDGSVDISGMTQSEVEQLVEQRAAKGITATLTININGNGHTLRLVELGDVQPQETAAAAFAPYEGTELVDRCVTRVKELLGQEVVHEKHNVMTSYDVSDKALRKAIKKIAAEENCDASDAGYEYDEDKGKVVVIEAKDGMSVDVKKTLALAREAIEQENATTSIDAVVKKVKAKKKAGQAIWVNLSTCTLRFYVNGKVKHEWPCTPGMSGYETPSGDWTLEYKDGAPVWTNPHSDWSANMAETIEPGPNNPLGLRALAVSCGGGIFIHGTTNTSQLGSTGSHGCVRLSNDNIVTLYDEVETGIPIFIH